MQRKFWQATLISLGAYTAAVLIGFASDFRLTMFAVPALLVTWTLFCTVRTIQLRFEGAHRGNAPACERESYGFAVGGTLSSFVWVSVIIVLSQLA